jgi:PhoH-like ATPase
MASPHGGDQTETDSRVKNYILDTNVLLHDPDSLLNFKDNHVLIPIEVIEEIDRFKRESTELGQNARAVSRMLDGFRAGGSLSEGVKLPNGGKLKVAFQPNGHANGANGFNGNTVDNRILSLAAGIQKAQPKNSTILVSKDINLRIKADALGLQAEDYENDRVFIQDLYTGMIELPASPEKVAAFRANGELELNGGKKYFPNEYCALIDETNLKRTALSKVDATGTKLVPIGDYREGVWGIKPRNREQHFAFDALLDDRVKLVTLMGKAGTGKTLLAMAAGLKRTVLDREFRRLVVARPTRLRKNLRRGCNPFTMRWKC